MDTIYKLTTQDRTTHNGYQWEIGQWHGPTSGQGPLCTPAWLHGYADPLVAVFQNPIDAAIANPLVWRAEGDGQRLDDHGLECGYTRMRILERMDLFPPTDLQRIRYGIGAAWHVCDLQDWRAWATGWLTGKNRTTQAARAAAAALWAVATTAAQAAAAAAAAAWWAVVAAAVQAAAAAWWAAWAVATTAAQAAAAAAWWAAWAAALDFPEIARWAMSDALLPKDIAPHTD